MSSHQTLQANKREASGTSAAKRLRREGIVPAVIYGAAQRTYAVQVDAKEFSDLLREQSSSNFLVNLEIEGAQEKTKLAMVQGVQQDPLSGSVMHIDFQAVKEDETVHANIPIELIGTPEGVKNGGVLDHQLHSIEIFCRPADLPEKIELEVSELGLGDAAHVGAIKFPGGVETHMDAEVVVAMIAEPRVAAAAEDEAAAGGDAAAPAADAPAGE